MLQVRARPRNMPQPIEVLPLQWLGTGHISKDCPKSVIEMDSLWLCRVKSSTAKLASAFLCYLITDNVHYSAHSSLILIAISHTISPVNDTTTLFS